MVILQPGYLPWLGFFEQLAKSDVFVIYDDVYYDKHGWRNRNRIKTPQGAQWLTVPIRVDFRETIIRDVKIDNNQIWPKKHIKTVKQNYSSSLFFDRYFGAFEAIIGKKWEYLIDLDMELTYWLAEELDIKRNIMFSSDLNVQGDRINRLIKICKKVGANKFYEGAAGKNYIGPTDFENEGIKVDFQEYVHPQYRQLHKEFIPYLSAIDLSIY